MSEQFDAILSTLTERERAVLTTRYGVEAGENPITFAEIGKTVTHTAAERARQIEAKALRKLRHPMRSREIMKIVGAGLADETDWSIIQQVYSLGEAQNAIGDFDVLCRERYKRYVDSEITAKTADEFAEKLYPEIEARVIEEVEKRIAEGNLAKAIIPDRNDLWENPIEYWDFSVRAFNCLKRAGLKNAADVLGWCDTNRHDGESTWEPLTRMRNLGSLSFHEIEQKFKKLEAKST